MARRIHEVMTRRVGVLAPEDSLLDAAERLRGLEGAPVPVCHGRRVVGMLPDGDSVVRAVAMGWDTACLRIADMMSPGIESCFEDEEADVVRRRMEQRRVEGLLVLDRARQLVGRVVLGDLAAEDGLGSAPPPM